MHGGGQTESSGQRDNRCGYFAGIFFVWKELAIAMLMGALTQFLGEDVN